MPSPNVKKTPAINKHNTKNRLADSDQDFIRVLDDLIEILMEKNIIQFTDFHERAQEKITQRGNLRQSLNSLQNFITEQNDELNF